MKKILLLSFVLCVFFTSCTEKKSNEDFLQTESGLLYKFHESNEAEMPEPMNLLDVYLSCKVNDSIVIVPNNFMTMQLSDPMFQGDLFEGLKMMHKGDSASFIVRIDSTFYTLFQLPMLPPEFSLEDVMRFDVRLIDFYDKDEFIAKRIQIIKETFPAETESSEAELKSYLSDNGINVEPTSSGLYYIKTKDGNGEKPSAGTMVSVHYTGTLLDGTVFDSSIERNEPIQFILGEGQVIQGWDEGIQLMSKGEKGVLYIPYYLAYGDTGAGIIPPFATLKFEVELIDF